MVVKHKTKVTRITRYLPWLLLPGVAAVLYGYLAVWNPLPSDEEMIENFKAHRADFVEVVRRYRAYPRAPDKSSAFWYREGDTLELFRRAGIDSVDRSAPEWLPNPYTLETARRELKLGLHQEDYEALYQYSSLRIRPATTPRIDHPDHGDSERHYRSTLLFGVIWKDYQFFPEVPRIENGQLLGPLQIVGKAFPGNKKYHEAEDVFTRQSTYRVLPSLNRLPSNWKDFECVYRRIEPQWFIRMCSTH